MNFPMNNYYGLTTDHARFLKAGIDANYHLSTREKYMEKCAISNQIADPIDREAELRCDWVDCGKKLAHMMVKQYCSPVIAFLADACITYQLEIKQQRISQNAETVHRWRDSC